MITTISRTCLECGVTFDAASASFAIGGTTLQLDQSYCDPCVAANEKRLSVCAIKDRRREPWAAVCDAAYLDFNMDRLPTTSQGFASKVLEWKDGPRGIGLAGPSRIGKTFVLTELFRRHYEYGKTVKMVLGTEFAYAMGSPDGSERRDMIDSCIAAEMLFIDDIAKPKMTDRVESDLFHVIEKRRRNLRPVFATLNGDGKTLAAMLSHEGGNAVVNRLRHDVCEFISIDAK